MRKYLAAALVAFAFAVSASPSHAAIVESYGDVTVANSPNGPVWVITSDMAGTGYGGIYIENPGLAANDLVWLSAMYQMIEGTFGGGAPRFTIFDNAFNSAWLYWGAPSFVDPNLGSWGPTGNLVSSTSLVYSNNFGGFNSPNTPVTWADFIAMVGAENISYIFLDLDGGFTGTQQLITNTFTVNNDVYNPSIAQDVPEPSTMALMGFGLLLLSFGWARAQRRV